MRTTLRTRKNLVGAAGLVATLGLVIGPASAAQAATTGHVVSTIPVPTHTYSALATGLGSVWLADTDENSFATVVRINPATNRVTGPTTLDIAAGGFAVGYGSLWVAGWATNTVERIDPSTMRETARIRTKLGPEALVAELGSIWVGNHHDHSVSTDRPDDQQGRRVVHGGHPERLPRRSGLHERGQPLPVRRRLQHRIDLPDRTRAPTG